MTWEIAKDVLLDALKDSGLVLLFVFVFHVLLSFIEDKLSHFLTKNHKIAPLFGSIFGIIPQCGTSVLASDLFVQKYISLGTLIAVFLSCSDEALIVLLTNPSEKTIMVLPLIASKFVIGFLIGYLTDVIFKNQEIKESTEELKDVTCEPHHHKSVKLHKHFLHPLIHSLEIFLFVFVINVGLGLLIAYVGEATFANFMVSNRYLTPLFTSIIGMIPNCVGSVLISELYLSNALPFGALLSGLLMNAGLGMMILLKNKDSIKKTIIVFLICFITSIIFGYTSSLIEWFMF
ncbi:MAG: arsenic efflux protein [Bacilli bacterium]|nr:arsenic efflux protein [Bacilli bacterium]